MFWIVPGQEPDVIWSTFPMDTLPLPARPDLVDYIKLAKELVEAAHSENTSAVTGFCNDWLDEIVRLSGPDLTDFVRGSWEQAIGEVEKTARDPLCLY